MNTHGKLILFIKLFPWRKCLSSSLSIFISYMEGLWQPLKTQQEYYSDCTVSPIRANHHWPSLYCVQSAVLFLLGTSSIRDQQHHESTSDRLCNWSEESTSYFECACFFLKVDENVAGNSDI